MYGQPPPASTRLYAASGGLPRGASQRRRAPGRVPGGVMRNKAITIFGGSGFLGRHLVRRLARLGATLRVPTRHPERANYLKPLGDVGQIVLEPWDPGAPGALERLIG